MAQFLEKIDPMKVVGLWKPYHFHTVHFGDKFGARQILRFWTIFEILHKPELWYVPEPDRLAFWP